MTSSKLEPILPPSWLGMLGGGQLGRMFVQAAQRYGYRVCVLDPDPDSPAGKLADRHLCAAYDDLLALQELGQKCAAVTTEFENVPAQALDQIAAAGAFVAPKSAAVSVAQNRADEKQFFAKLAADTGIQPAPHAIVETEADFDALPADCLPGILKTARMGYDGKGQTRVATVEEARDAWRGLGGVPCVLEKMLSLAFEVSALVARGAGGDTVVYPLAENVHRNGILHTTCVPSLCVDAATADKVRACAQKIAAALDYVGVLCVEFFVLTDGTVVVNEMAPRPHNSGHYTIDACVTNQFEQQLRAITRLPLGSPRLLSPVAMLNLLGDVWFDGDECTTPNWPAVMANPDARLHLYGKAEPRRGRKMGHINCVAATPAAALADCDALARLLRIDA